MSPFDIWKIIGEKVIEVTEVERISRDIAKSLGCNGDTDHEILHCMRERPLSEIMSLYSNDSWNRVMQPISDNFLPESEQFLPNSIMTALTNQATKIQIEVLLGATDLEALNNNVMKYEELMKQGKLYANNKVIVESLRFFSLDRSEMLPLLVEAVRWEYWNNKTRNVKEVLSNVEFLGRVESAAKWNSGIVLIAARLAKRVKRLFVYRYSQSAGVDLEGQQYNFTGAVHGSDLVSLLGDALMLQVARRPSTKEEKRVSFLLRRHLINFIQFGSPGEESIWQPYKSPDANVYDIHDTINSYPYYHSAERDVRFWLQYLPQLNIILDTTEKTGKLTDEKDDNRLRGGVLAMCGVTIVLLLLLVICAIILHRQRSRRFTVVDENHH
uniref:SFRICE_006852 n=1 Tax=Spodoptera frugiperda TaxID=7108 RepID=A0A2H1W623_SPOFR